MVGVDQSLQGQGLDRVLMADVLKRVAQTSEEVGVAALVLDVLEDDDVFEKHKAFYTSLGFVSLDSRPGRMFISTSTIHRQLVRTKMTADMA